METLLDRIAKIATEEGISITRLEQRIGASKGVLSRALQNKTDIQAKWLEKIVENFPRYNLDWLITGEGEMLKTPSKAHQTEKRLIPLYADVTSIGGNNGTSADVATPYGNVLEWIDAGDWFPGATAAIHHYGDSMVEYPSGCILALKRVEDTRLIINGKAYVIETDEFRITKQLQYDGGDYIMAYSSNNAKYDDGRLIHAPIRIPMDAVRHIDLVIGYVVKEFSNGAIPIIKRYSR